MSKKLTLAELMGSSAASRGEQGLSLKQLPVILGDAMPDLPKNAVGRHRLVRALQQRFGPNFRSLPGVGGLIKEFDTEVELETRVQRIASIRLSDFKKEKK